ncbi:MAG TPA: lysozyme [Kaistia sp.]|nr:lysozyme [Kaistia sp.]
MPVNKLTATKRGKAAIAAVLAVTIGGVVTLATGEKIPPAVVLADKYVAGPWEGLKTAAYWDADGKVWTVCRGETKGVKKGDRYTVAQCEAMFVDRLNLDFYKPIIKCAPALVGAPVSVQAAMLSGAYNFGVTAWCKSTAAARVRAKDFRAACVAQTAFNRAGGRVLPGLVNRREMGDAQRIGEAELCLSGL